MVLRRACIAVIISIVWSAPFTNLANVHVVVALQPLGVLVGVAQLVSDARGLLVADGTCGPRRGDEGATRVCQS